MRRQYNENLIQHLLECLREHATTIGDVTEDGEKEKIVADAMRERTGMTRGAFRAMLRNVEDMLDA